LLRRSLSSGLRLPRPASFLSLPRLAALPLTVVLPPLVTLSSLDGALQLLVLLIADPALTLAALVILVIAVAHMALSALIIQLIALPALATLVVLLVVLPTTPMRRSNEMYAATQSSKTLRNVELFLGSCSGKSYREG